MTEMENKQYSRLSDILTDFDKSGKRFDSHTYVSALNTLPETEWQKQECQYEWTAFMLQPNDSEKTFGGYYGPQFTMRDADGNPVYTPPLSCITPDCVQYWEQRYKSASNSVMRMRYAGLVWDFKKRIVGSKYESDLYRIYVDSMLDVCNNDLAVHPTVTISVLERLFMISKSQQVDLNKTKDTIRSFELRHTTDQSVCYWTCQFSLMADNQKCFTQEEIKTLVKQHEARMARLAMPNAEGKVDVWMLDSQCDILADFYNRIQQKDDVRRVMKVSETAHRNSFDPGNPIQRIGILEQFHHKYVHYGLIEDANALLPEIQSAGADASKSMQTNEYEYSLPETFFEEADKLFGSKAETDEIRWQNFVSYFVPHQEFEKKSLAESVKNYPLRYMIPTKLMDFKGRPQSVIGTYEKDPDGNLVAYITEKMNLETYFLLTAIRKMHDVGLFTEDRIMNDFIEPCPLFEETSYAIIRQAINFLFDNQPVVACHLLVPQIEAAIRNLVERSGYSVIKPQRQHQRQQEKGFQLITLDDLLRKEPVEYVFSHDGAMYLRLVLTDQRSLNIRNTLCHGLLPPDCFHWGIVARLLHILVMIGMVRPEENNPNDQMFCEIF